MAKKDVKAPEVETNARAGALVNMVLTALMAGVVFVVTYFLRIPMPGSNGGIINLGDLAVYITAILLANPWAAIAASLGSGLMNISIGLFHYAPATFIIKGTMGLIVSGFAKNGSPAMFKLGTLIAGIIMLGGYFVYDLFFFRAGENLAWVIAIDGLVGNIIQALVCVLLSWIIYKPMKSLKNRLMPQ